MPEKTVIEPIAHIFTDMPDKFGIPRQSGLVPGLTGKIVFEPEYRSAEALRGLDGFSHLWLIWRFSLNENAQWHPTVRPPRLGGNVRVGVFASRSPFRPNFLGLSCVRLERTVLSGPDAPYLVVSGVDMADGTPVFDIKPYIPVSDLRPEAADGYTALTKEHSLSVVFSPGTSEKLPGDKLAALTGLLSGDPRPGYDDDPGKRYGLTFAGFEIGFTVSGGILTVVSVENGER